MKKVDILLPCYNEEKVIGECIDRIKKVIKKDKKYDYSIVVCDNNSNDNSYKIASKKAKVLVEKERGYGATINNGIKNSTADYIITLDCDLSYDETDIPMFIEELDKGYDVVIGNRYKGGIQKGAMSLSHKIGVVFLTEYANLLFHTKSHDFHCGIRAFRRDAINKCNIESKEFTWTTEMTIKAKLNKLKIKEVPTKLFPDGRDRKSYLRTFRDGSQAFHLTNKLKFESSVLFRYLSVYFIVLFLMCLSLVIASAIPRKVVRDNAIQSIKFLEDKYTNNRPDKKYMFFEMSGDSRNVAMAFNMDSKKIIDSSIRMSYLEDVEHLFKMDQVLEKESGNSVNYSRYWQGQVVYSKITMVFLPLSNKLYIIQLIILTILFLYLSYKLFKKDIILGLSFVIASIGINAFFTAFSVQYFFCILLSFIFSLIALKLYDKNSKYVGVMFAIDGMLTAFLDFLTCETLALTIPLFIYTYLCIKDKKEKVLKNVIKYVFIWGLFYLLTFGTKWIIDMIYFGPSYIKEIFNKASIRVGGKKLPFYLGGAKGIMLCLNNIIPFAFTKYGFIYLIALFLVSLYSLVFNNKEYYPLLLITMIPIVRCFVLVSHSIDFNYFVYRSFGVLLMFICIEVVYSIKKILK
ncbi:MAG: glycosyltransferase family 2 protein [Bacilli bacterium]|nr:glycosyltransferase family 2 protein [Bacilli bacterium]